MLSINIIAFIIINFGVASVLAQDNFALTGYSGACSAETDQTINSALQEQVVLRANITQAKIMLEDIVSMQSCAQKQMVWVPGHINSDRFGCIPVESFRGVRGDRGPRGRSGRNASCP